MRALLVISWFVCATLLVPRPAFADPYGPSFRVNSPSPGYKMGFVATNAHNESIVFWLDLRAGLGMQGFIKRYDAVGQALHVDQVVSATVRDVAIDDQGNYAILEAAGGFAIVTVFDRFGQVKVPALRVNEAGKKVSIPKIRLAMNGRGDFAVTWPEEIPGRSIVMARSYAADGTPRSAPILVSDAALQFEPDIGIDALGNFVVTWDTWRGQPNTYDVFARRFAPNGAAYGPAFLVNGSAAPSAHRGRVAMNASGAFVIAWVTQATTSAGVMFRGIIAQRFGPGGSRLGAELHNDVGSGIPAVAMASTGAFAIASGNGTPVRARLYDPQGVPFGASFVLSDLAGTGGYPSVSMDALGNFTAVWGQREPNSTEQTDIYQRRYWPSGITVTPLANDQLVSGLSGSTHSWRFYKVSVAPGHSTVDFSIFGGVGDADLYVRWGALPTLDDWDGAPFLNGNQETARMLNYPAGDWYVGIHGYSAYSGLGLHTFAH